MSLRTAAAIAVCALLLNARSALSQRLFESVAGVHSSRFDSHQPPLQTLSISVADSNRVSPAPFLLSGIIVGALVGAATYRLASSTDEPFFVRPITGILFISGGGLLGGLVGLMIWSGVRNPPPQRGLTRS
jgi:hypothetical protein